MVDSIKDQESFRMARCLYFSVECDTPSTGWQLGLESGYIPFLMLGLSGIITKPIKGDSFNNEDDIDSLFETIEKHENLYVDINDIWLPLFVLDKNAERSDVYRIPFELFSIAYDYTLGRTSIDEYLENVRKHQASKAALLLAEIAGMKLPEHWRFERMGKEREVFYSWQTKAINKRKAMKFAKAHETYALGRKPEKHHE